MAGGSPLCLAGRWLVDWFWQRDWECWLTVCWLDAWCFYTSKSRLKWLNWLVLTDCMAGGSPLCLAGRWLVDWFWQRDWHNVWLTVGWWVAWYIFYSKIETKNWLTCLDQLTDCMAGGSPLCLAGRWLVKLVLAKRLTECLADCWLVGGFYFVAAKLRLKTDWLVLISWLLAWLAAPLFA